MSDGSSETGSVRAETGRRSLPYMPGLDGLRAVAVVAVLLYHADMPWVPAGFLGVEVFFVISGYLITSLLLAEWHVAGRIDLPRFWMRRARRLLPALFALLGAVCGFAALRLPHLLAGLRGDVLAALTYVTNWYLVAQDQSYFEQMARPSLLKHLWSLAVEEQFYIFWPIVVALGLRWLGRRALFVSLLGGIATSAVLAYVAYVPGADPSRVYYGTDTRAAGLLVGAALAFVWNPWALSRRVGSRGRILIDLLGLAALAELAISLLAFGDDTPALYRGGFLAVSLATAVLIACAIHPAGRLGRVMGVRPMRWIGTRSYGIYLWHWPIFMVTRPWVDIALDGPALLAYRFAMTFVLAELSYRYVEQPIRRGLSYGRPEVGWLPAARARATGGAALRLAGGLAVLTVAGLPLVGLTPLAIHRSLAMTVVPVEASASTDPAGAAHAGTPEARDGSLALGEELPGRDLPDADRAGAASDGGPDAPATATLVWRVPTATGPGGGLQASVRRATPARDELAEHDPWLAPLPPPTPVPLTATVRVSFLGDSVMLGAKPAIIELFGPDTFVDASLSRQFPAGLEAAQAMARTGRLGDVVVVHLGNNGIMTEEHFDQLMAVLRDVPHVFFLTVKVPRRWEGSVNDALTEGVRRWPNTSLVDWRAASLHKPELFLEDGIHLFPDGRPFYARLILDAITARLEETPTRTASGRG